MMMQTTYRFAFEWILALCLIILIGLTNRNIGAELFQNLAGLWDSMGKHNYGISDHVPTS
jgi:hypothetical protein